MNPDILHRNESVEFYTEELCYILELSNTAEDEAVCTPRFRPENYVDVGEHAPDLMLPPRHD